MMPANRIDDRVQPQPDTVVEKVAAMAATSIRKTVQFLGAIEVLAPETAGLEVRELRGEAEALGRKLRQFLVDLGEDPGTPFPWEVGP